MKPCLTLGLLLAAVSVACHGECDCSSPGLFVIAEGVSVVSMSLSGPGCTDAVVYSTVPSSPNASTVGRHTGFEPGGLFYSIMPVQPGDCTVAIGLDSGVMLERAVAFAYHGGDCCAGYYTHDSRWRLRDWALDASVD